MSHSNPMYAVLLRLWREAPKMKDPSGREDPSQAPAVVCHVMLKGSVSPLYGALSQTTEGPLRMLTRAQVQGEDGRARAALIESFFDVDDVVSISIERELAVEQSRIQLA